MNTQIKIKKQLKFVIGFLTILLVTNLNFANAQTIDCQSIDFKLATEYAIGSIAYSFTSADINGDGIVDIITPNSSAQIISVLSGDGTGGFAPALIYPTGIASNTVTAGDINQDGKLDLIAAGYFGGSKIAVLLNNGNSGFSAPIITTVPSNIGQFHNIKVGDFNGDGSFDLAGVTDTNLNFFLGNGQGGFTLNTTLTWNGNKGEIIIGNFNNDNLTDLVLTGGNFSGIWELGVVLGKSSGSFAFNNRFSLDNQPSSIVVGEYNGDGKIDIAIAANYPYANSTPPTYFMQPWFGNETGSFTAGTKVFLPFTIYGMTTGDFDGDGKLDLAASLGSTISTVNGVGDGTFRNKRFWETPPSERLSTADVNQDGKSDLLYIRSAAADSYVSVVMSTGNEFLAPKSIVYGGTDIIAADFNNDNLLDMVTGTDTNFGGSSEIVIALNDGNGGLLPDRNFGTAIALADLAVGDFNGDGNKDVVTAHANNGRLYAAYLGDEAGNLSAPVSQQWSRGVEGVVTGDFNNDGKDDVLIIDDTPRGYPRLSNGDGTFSSVPNFYIDSISPLNTPQTGDFNHDGKLDLVVSDGTTVKIWLGVGNGTFTVSDSQPFNASRITVGDLDADGNLDVIGINASFSQTILSGILGKADGTFGDTFSKTIASGSGLSISSGDFNADGFTDIIYNASTSQGNLAIIPSTGQAPYFDTPIFYYVGGIGVPFYGEANPIIAADYNGDNKIDIGFTYSRSRGVIYNTSSQKPCVSIDDVTVTEGDGNTINAMFTVSLSSASSQIVRVNYSLEAQSAILGSDFANVSGRLEIPAGQTSAIINIPINGDLLDEFDETFVINLTSPANGALAKSTGTGTILDNDAEPSLTVTDVSQAEPTFSQGFTFRVNLSAPSGKPITFQYATSNGTATAGTDYFAIANATRTVPAGTTFVDFSVTVINDFTYEPDETFFLNISNPTNASLSDAQGRGTIVNNDPVPTVSVFTSSSRR